MLLLLLAAMLHKTIKIKIKISKKTKNNLNLLKHMFGRWSRGFVPWVCPLSPRLGHGGAWQGGVMRSSAFNPFTTTQAVSSLSVQTFCTDLSLQLVRPLMWEQPPPFLPRPVAQSVKDAWCYRQWFIKHFHTLLLQQEFSVFNGSSDRNT